MHGQGTAEHPSAALGERAERDYSGRVENDDTTPEASEPSAEEPPPSDPSARWLWMILGITFFAVGVTFTIVMPDNIALGVTFLGVGVVFYSLAGSAKTP